MDWLIKWSMILCLLGSVSLCEIASATQAKPSTPSVVFKKKKISINKIPLVVEMAETADQQQQGLMFRTKLDSGTGMLFVFSDEDFRNFWMKNTYIDLSIGYFDKNRKLLEVLNMKATNMMQKDFPTYPSTKPAQYALEVPLGWFEKHRVRTGDSFKFD